MHVALRRRCPRERKEGLALTGQARRGIDPLEKLAGAEVAEVVRVSGKEALTHVHSRARHGTVSVAGGRPFAAAALRAKNAWSFAFPPPVLWRSGVIKCVPARS